MIIIKNVHVPVVSQARLVFLVLCMCLDVLYLLNNQNRCFNYNSWNLNEQV